MLLVLLIEATEFLVEHSPPWSKSSNILQLEPTQAFQQLSRIWGVIIKFSRYDFENTALVYKKIEI
jgi:hypothetical protein|tara:strand:- start:1212 stop:1409 length:198 start_codon:yes stop_codon:yes gene_type:complete